MLKPLMIDTTEYTIGDVKVGQVWKCLEDSRVVLISMVKPKEICGYIFTGFEVAPYFTFALNDFVKYFTRIYDPKRTK